MRYRQTKPLTNLEKMLRNSNKDQIRNILGASLVAQMVKNLPAMQEAWFPSPGQEDLLGKGMATHSSILAWRIPWAEEPGGLQPMGSQESDRTE